MTFTVDVEDHRGGAATAARFERMTERLLEFFDAREIKATCFIEGAAARQAPGLVRRIAALGHEVGSHGYRHVALRRETPAVFGPAMAAERRRLEDLAGRAVVGFRAPGFSLVPAALWATESLAAAGFSYSSSVIPGRALSQGFPGAPCRPFLWPSGLLEIPCPVGRVGPFSVPFQGGMYLRYLPPWRYRWLAAQLGDQVNWTYCHPYDIDLEEKFSRVAGCGWVGSFFLWANRRTMMRRWVGLAGNAAAPFGERITEFKARPGGSAPWTPA